jgi:hypothetical protein
MCAGIVSAGEFSLLHWQNLEQDLRQEEADFMSAFLIWKAEQSCY